MALRMLRSPQAHEAMDALRFNLRQEHIVIYDFVSNFHQVPPRFVTW